MQELLEQLRTTVTLAQQNDSHKHIRSNQRAGGQADGKSAASSNGTVVEGEDQGEGVATEDSNALGSSAGAEGEETGILGQDSTAGELVFTKFMPTRVQSFCSCIGWAPLYRFGPSLPQLLLTCRSHGGAFILLLRWLCLPALPALRCNNCTTLARLLNTVTK